MVDHHFDYKNISEWYRVYPIFRHTHFVPVTCCAVDVLHFWGQIWSTSWPNPDLVHRRRPCPVDSFFFFNRQVPQLVEYDKWYTQLGRRVCFDARFDFPPDACHKCSCSAQRMWQRTLFVGELKRRLFEYFGMHDSSWPVWFGNFDKWTTKVLASFRIQKIWNEKSCQMCSHVEPVLISPRLMK